MPIESKEALQPILYGIERVPVLPSREYRGPKIKVKDKLRESRLKLLLRRLRR